MIKIREDLKARMDATGIPYKIYAEILDDATVEQFADCLEAPGVVQGALMADAHLGYTAPIGSVFAIKDKLYSSFVGYDIGCGLISAELNIKAEELDLNKLKEDILRSVPIGFNRHKKAQKYVMPKIEPSKELLQAMDSTGKFQLGTLGGGNHFIELGTSEKTGLLHIIIHSGSRGFGHKVATHYMKEAAIQSIDEQRYIDEFKTISKNIEWLAHINSLKPSTKTDNIQDAYNAAMKDFVYRRTKARLKTDMEGNYSLDFSTHIGRQYYRDQNIALDFALANRQAMVNAIVLDIQTQIGKPLEVISIINKNHNHAELIDGHFIHRKGATQASKGMYGIIPGNMKDGCFIVEGLGNEDSMNSSSHGAGRVLSRRKAKEQLSLDKFHSEMKGIVTNHKDATIDEAPDAYKNIFEVMEAQEDLVKIIAHIKPVLNIKG